MSEVIALDFETFYSKKLKHSVRVQIAEEYCNSPHFEPYLVTVCDGAQSWAGEIKNFNWNSVDGRDLCSHNAYFERSVFKRMKEMGLVPKHVRPRNWYCTANMTSYMCGRRALDDAVLLLMGIEVKKTVRSDAEGRHWADFTPEEKAAMIKYGRMDSVYCKELFTRFFDKWPVTERRLSEMTIAQGMHGIQIDRELLDQSIMQTHEMAQNAKNLIPWIGDDIEDEWEGFEDNIGKPGSTKCIAEQCRRSGIPCCPVKSDDEEAFVQWELTYAPAHPWIKALASWRSINKLYKTYMLVKQRTRPDGTMPFATKYFGAHTGRWSGDARINFQNMRKKPLICRDDGLMEDNERKINDAIDTHAETGKWPGWVRYAIDFRHLFTARPGKKMIASDLSQIEPRVLAWLAKDWGMLEMLKTGMSVYEAHARNTMGWKGGDLKTEDPDQYKLAKARILALGYQAAWEKFITMAYDLARVDITKDDPEFVEELNEITGLMEKVSGYGYNAKKTVETYRLQNPLIKGLWGRLDDAFKRSIGKDFTMTLPSNRKMVYRKVKCETRIFVDPKTKKARSKTVFTADVGGKRKSCYGGLLTENLTQATARDVFAEHLVRLEDAGMWNLFGVHDEAVLEVDNDVTAADVEEIMSYCPEWLKGCPIRAEAKEIPHYLK